MKNKHKLGSWGLIFLMSILTIFAFNTNKVSASLTSSNDLTVLKDAPNGLPVSSYMSNGTPISPIASSLFSLKYPYMTNSAQIVDHNGANTPIGNVVSLANGKKTYGSIWSTDQTFDINKPQTISAWLYFGSGTGDTAAINSEGIAFVLQNDKRGVQALGAAYDGLGVYGFDNSITGVSDSPTQSISYIASTAIQNSIALEFDTQLNSPDKPDIGPIFQKTTTIFGITTPSLNSQNSQNSLDTATGKNIPADLGLPGSLTYGAGGGYGHIAVTYPAFTGTYAQFDVSAQAASKYPGFDQLTTMVHENKMETSLTDSKDSNNNPVYWHHVTINWTPAPSGSKIATLSYHLRDINKDGTENNSSKVIHDDVPVDTTKLNTTSGKVRWGFTGATGTTDDSATKLVAFDSIPDALYSDASSSITDKTLNKTISLDATDKTVADGDDLALNYNLNYVRGNEDWKSIAAKIQIPDNVTVTPDANGNVATITYADDKTPIGITKDDIANGSLQYTLAKDLSSTNSPAQITISATANNDTSSDIDVAKAPASFTGTNSIALTSSPAFTILAKKNYTLNLSTDSDTNYNLLYNNDDSTWDPNLNLNYSENATDLKDPDVVFNITVDDHTYTAATDAELNGSSITIPENIDFLKIIKGSGDDIWKIFPLDSTKTVTVTAIDRANGMVSNPLDFTVKVQPNKSLHLNVSDSLTFQDINFGNRSTYLKRKSDFNLSVTSLREPWILSVASDGLYDSDKTLNDNFALVYKKDNDSNYQAINDSPLVIETNNNSYDKSTTDDISSDWTSDTGLLLKQIELSPAGKYSGTLKWYVSDVMPNE